MTIKSAINIALVLSLTDYLPYAASQPVVTETYFSLPVTPVIVTPDDFLIPLNKLPDIAISNNNPSYPPNDNGVNPYYVPGLWAHGVIDLHNACGFKQVSPTKSIASCNNQIKDGASMFEKSGANITMFLNTDPAIVPTPQSANAVQGGVLQYGVAYPGSAEKKIWRTNSNGSNNYSDLLCSKATVKVNSSYTNSSYNNGVFPYSSANDLHFNLLFHEKNPATNEDEHYLYLQASIYGSRSYQQLGIPNRNDVVVIDAEGGGGIYISQLAGSYDSFFTGNPGVTHNISQIPGDTTLQSTFAGVTPYGFHNYGFCITKDQFVSVIRAINNVLISRNKSTMGESVDNYTLGLAEIEEEINVSPNSNGIYYGSMSATVAYMSTFRLQP